MSPDKKGAFIRNIAEVPWREFPDHFGGALSKPLVMPETANSRHLDYRISMYQPMARVARHKHKIQEQIYHVLEGEGLMEIEGENHVVRKHDFIYLPPGIAHAIPGGDVARQRRVVRRDLRSIGFNRHCEERKRRSNPDR